MKKMMRKTFTVLLALAMTMALGLSAFAADITVTNPQDGETYTAYKIFSLKKSGTTNYDYTLDSTSAAYTLLTNALTTQTAADQLPAGVTLTPTTGTDASGNIIYNASVTNAAGFAKWLKQHASSLDAAKAKTGALSNGEYKIDVGSELGYWFVNTTTGAVANLTTVNDELNIRDKNETPEIQKSVSDASVEVGQTVTYTVDGEVPDTTGYTAYTYNISDTMSQGLTFNNSVSNMKVKVGDTVLIGTAGQGETDGTSGTNVPTLTYTANGFTLTFDMTKFQDQVGDAIVVTYDAIVNDNAVANVTSNSATLQYSNDPADQSSTATTPPEEVEVYSSSIVVDKYKDGDSTTKLANAKFILVKKTTTGEAPNQTTTESYYKYTAAANGNPAAVTWVSDKTQATEVTTNGSGAASFPGLEDGTYYLRETQAPEGYNLLTSDVEVTIAHTTDQTTNKAVGVNHTESIANRTGSLLPATGGIGTIGLTVLGILAVVFGVCMKPKKADDSAE